jgi:hypothetical protein
VIFDGSVGIVSRLWDGRTMSGIRFQATSSPVIMRLDHEADHPPPSSAEVRTACSLIYSLPSLRSA